MPLPTGVGARASPALAASPGLVIVGWGDTLYSIATQNGTTVDALILANSLPDATHIWVGQRLVIPSGNSVPAPNGAPPGSGLYTVSAGDTVRNVAARFGITLNGDRIDSQPAGWYLDRAFHKVALPDLCEGENELVLSCAYTNWMEIEEKISELVSKMEDVESRHKSEQRQAQVTVLSC